MTFDKSTKNSEELQLQFLENAVEKVMLGSTIEDALNIDKKITESFYSIGYSLYQQAKYQQALRYFKHAVALDIYEIRYLFAYAKCLKNIGEIDESIAYLALAQLIRPEEPKIAFEISECFLKKGMIEEACKIIEMIENFFKDSSQEIPELKQAVNVKNFIQTFPERFVEGGVIN